MECSLLLVNSTYWRLQFPFLRMAWYLWSCIGIFSFTSYLRTSYFNIVFLCLLHDGFNHIWTMCHNTFNFSFYANCSNTVNSNATFKDYTFQLIYFSMSSGILEAMVLPIPALASAISLLALSRSCLRLSSSCKETRWEKVTLVPFIFTKANLVYIISQKRLYLNHNFPVYNLTLVKFALDNFLTDVQNGCQSETCHNFHLSTFWKR